MSGTSSINKVDSFDFSIYFQVVEDGYRFFEKRKVFRPCNYFIVKGNPREGVGSWGEGGRRILQGNLGAGHCVLTHSQAKIYVCSFVIPCLTSKSFALYHDTPTKIYTLFHTSGRDISFALFEAKLAKKQYPL